MDPEKVEAFKRGAIKYKVERPPELSDLETRVTEAFRVRGVSMESANKLSSVIGGGEAAVWSKSYTENSSNRLVTPDGRILFETNTPLTNAELEIIEELDLKNL